MKKEAIVSAAMGVQSELVRVRRELHKLAEPSGKEVKTSLFIEQFCEKRGWKVSRNENTNAIICDIGSDKPEVAFRADMDALPGFEPGNSKFASKSGYSHFCGHDMHLTMLLGLAMISERIPEFPPFRMLFQPHEELPPGGALEMISDGALDGIVSVYALHVDSLEDVGKVVTRPGAFFSAPDLFSIVIKGKGGHAAAPENTVDAIYIAAQVIVSAQALVTRRKSTFDPAVLSFTSVHGGENCNIMPDEVVIRGTLRTYDAGVRQQMIISLRDVAGKTASIYGGEAVLNIVDGYIALVNSPEKVSLAKRSVESLGIGMNFVDDARQKMYGEDFSYFLERCPGALMMIGAGTQGKRYPLHNSNVVFDEEVLWRGAALLSAILISENAQKANR